MIDSYDYYNVVFPKLIKGKIIDYGFGSMRLCDLNVGPAFGAQYIGIDPDLAAVNQASELYPFAKFYHHDLTEKKLPDIASNADTVISYDALLHLDIDTFFTVIRYLYDRTEMGGFLILNFLDAADQTTINHYKETLEKTYGFCDPIGTTRWQYVIENRLSYETIPGKEHLLFINSDYLTKTLDYSRIKIIPAYQKIPDRYHSYMFIEKLPH